MANPFKKPTERKQSVRVRVVKEGEPFEVGMDEIVDSIRVYSAVEELVEVIILKFLP